MDDKFDEVFMIVHVHDVSLQNLGAEEVPAAFRLSVYTKPL